MEAQPSGGDHGVDRVFEHQHPVAGGECYGAAGAALADDGGDDGDGGREAGLDGAGDGFGLAAGFGVDAGKRAGGVHEGEQRQAEAAGEIDQPARLAVALRLGAAEIVLYPRFGLAALLGADHHHRPAFEAAEPAHDRLVVGEGAVAGERREVGDQAGDVVQSLRALGVAGDLGLLPGGELGVGGAELAVLPCR